MPGILEGMDMESKCKSSASKAQPQQSWRAAPPQSPARTAQPADGGSGGAVAWDAPPSNTASHNCNSDCFKALRWGVDSLYLSYSGDLLPEVEAKLKALKQIAQSPEPRQQALAQYPIAGHFFEVKDKGAPLFPYILEDGSFRIQLSRPGKKVPMAYVKISSGYLAHVGAKNAGEALRRVLEQFGTLTDRAQVSRIDLFADFVSPENMEKWGREAWVTRAAGVNAYAVDGQFTGWAVGLGGTMAARLYNKFIEIQKSGKTYLFDLWRQGGWNEEASVWRLEFQFKREILTQLDVVSLAKVLDHLNGLWSYATTEWLRLAIPNPDDKTRSRWPIHPLWGYLSAIDWESPGGPLLRQYSHARIPGNDKLFSMYLGALISYMVKEKITDLYQGQEAMIAALVEYFSGKAHALGISFDDYIAERLAIKARQFNVLLFKQDAAQAVKDAEYERLKQGLAYRRASQGE